MARTIRALVGSFALVPIVAIAAYFWNPCGSASPDPCARLFGFAPYSIPGSSNSPTLNPGDIVVADTFAYCRKAPQIKDMIVIVTPEPGNTPLMKRVVATVGMSIAIESGTVVLDGQPLDEPYVLAPNRVKGYSQVLAESIVPDEMLFVMSDNRDKSRDSRWFGRVPTDNLIGQVRVER